MEHGKKTVSNGLFHCVEQNLLEASRGAFTAGYEDGAGALPRRGQNGSYYCAFSESVTL